MAADEGERVHPVDRVLAAILAFERERCAQIAEPVDAEASAELIAAAIRARIVTE